MSPEMRARERRWHTRVLVPIAVALALLFMGFIVFAAISESQDTAVSAKSLAEQIQRERLHNIRATCVAQNARHDATTKSLVDAAAVDIANQDTAAGKVEIRRRRDVTLALIDALAPRRNCDKVVALASPGG